MAVVAAMLALVVLPSAAAAAVVGAKPMPSWQSNGRVDVIVVSGTTAYLGGTFTTMRPAGAPAGVGEVVRNRVAAVDLTTGDLLPWDPEASGRVGAIAVDGATVYLGGTFSTVGGKTRRRIAAVDALTGVATAFHAAVNGGVRALAVADGRLYAGGGFTTPQTYVAAFDPVTGAYQSSWAATTDGPVDAIAAAAGGTRIVLGGGFNTLDGAASSAIGAVDPSTGASLPWSWHGPSRYFTTHPFDVVALAADATGVYAAGTGTGGSLLKFDATAGTPIYEGGADGNVVGVALLDGIAYFGGHFNVYCGPVMGYNNCSPTAAGAALRNKLLAVDASTGALQPWHPSANSSLGVFAVGAGAGALAAGGDFTKLAGVAQQGFGAFLE
jgi:hypothetical protein